MKHSEQAWLGRYLPVLLAGVVIGFVCGLQALHGLFPGFDLFERLELMSYDWRARRTFDTNAPVANLGVIFIDDQSLDQVNRNFEFSWP